MAQIFFDSCQNLKGLLFIRNNCTYIYDHDFYLVNLDFRYFFDSMTPWHPDLISKNLPRDQNHADRNYADRN